MMTLAMSRAIVVPEKELQAQEQPECHGALGRGAFQGQLHGQELQRKLGTGN
jgi:hypothetical protein